MAECTGERSHEIVNVGVETNQPSWHTERNGRLVRTCMKRGSKYRDETVDENNERDDSGRNVSNRGDDGEQAKKL